MLNALQYVLAIWSGYTWQKDCQWILIVSLDSGGFVKFIFVNNSSSFTKVQKNTIRI